MENWQTEESVDSLEVQVKNKRSILLLVLCILTWVGCAVPFMLKTSSFFNTKLAKVFLDMDRYSGVWFFLDWLLFPALCTLGAVFMFQLKRWGFWIYCLGQVPPTIYAIYMVVRLTESLGSGVFFGVLGNLFPIAFIVMYAIEMNKLSRKPVSTDF